MKWQKCNRAIATSKRDNKWKIKTSRHNFLINQAYQHCSDHIKCVKMEKFLIWYRCKTIISILLSQPLLYLFQMHYISYMLIKVYFSLLFSNTQTRLCIDTCKFVHCTCLFYWILGYELWLSWWRWLLLYLKSLKIVFTLELRRVQFIRLTIIRNILCKDLLNLKLNCWFDWNK